MPNPNDANTPVREREQTVAETPSQFNIKMQSENFTGSVDEYLSPSPSPSRRSQSTSVMRQREMSVDPKSEEEIAFAKKMQETANFMRGA